MKSFNDLTKGFSEINPIKNLKEREAVTYNGVGGRTSRSMTRSTRIYHKNDMGIISESTVDSSDVAINTYMSADPIFDSLRGTARIFDIEGKTADYIQGIKDTMLRISENTSFIMGNEV